MRWRTRPLRSATCSVAVGFWLMLCPALVRAEMPQEPTLEALCANAFHIVRARPMKVVYEYERWGAGEYQLVLFKVVDVLKSKRKLRTDNEAIEIWDKEVEGEFITVLLPAGPTPGESITPVYNPKRDYLLFLGPRLVSNVYRRAQLDTIWGARRWTQRKQDKIREIVEAQSTIYLYQPLNDSVQGIPAEASERVIELTEEDRKSGYGRQAEYWLNDQKVGERVWWASGQLCHEETLENDKRHGLFRSWYRDGRICQEESYRNGEYHGVNTLWDGLGVPRVSFWIAGQEVKESMYSLACRFGKTLPEYTRYPYTPATQPADEDNKLPATGTDSSTTASQPGPGARTRDGAPPAMPAFDDPAWEKGDPTQADGIPRLPDAYWRDPTPRSMAAINQWIHRLPPWGHNDFTPDQWEEYLRTARLLQRAEPDMVEYALEMYVQHFTTAFEDGVNPLAECSKPCILLRVMFVLPQTVDEGEEPSSNDSGTTGRRSDGYVELPLSYPVEWDAHGPRLVAGPAAGHSGPPYAVARQYRYFREHFKYRLLRGELTSPAAP